MLEPKWINDLKKGTFILKFTLNLIMICINVHTSIYIILKNIYQIKMPKNKLSNYIYESVATVFVENLFMVTKSIKILVEWGVGGIQKQNVS